MLTDTAINTDCRCAFRVGDDATMVSDVVAIYFRNNQRYVRICLKRRRVVDDNGAGSSRHRRILMRNLAAGAEKCDVDSIKCTIGYRFQRN